MIRKVFKKISLLLLFLFFLLYSKQINATTLDFDLVLDGNNASIDGWNASGDDYYVLYREDGNKYIKTNKKKYGPYSFVSSIHLTDSGLYFAYRSKTDWNSYFVNANDHEYGPYKMSEGDIEVSDNYIMYVETPVGEKNTVYLNNEKYGSYDYVADFVVDGDNWAFVYSTVNEGISRGYVNIKGVIYGPYSSVSNMVLKKNNWFFEYSKDGKSFLNFKGEEIEKKNFKIDYYTNDIVLSEDSWCFTYFNSNDNKKYVSIAGEVYGPYDLVRNLTMASKDMWGYKYRSNEKYGIMVNGKEYEEYGRDGYDRLYLSKNHWAISAARVDVPEIASEYLFIDNKYIGGFSSVSFSNLSELFLLIVRNNTDIYFFDGINKMGPIKNFYGFNSLSDTWSFLTKTSDNIFNLKIINGEYDDEKILISDIKENKNTHEILNLRAEYSKIENKAIIKWDTKIETRGSVKYGVINANIWDGKIDNKKDELEFRKEHSVIISPLYSYQGLVYQVSSEDREGNFTGIVSKRLLLDDPETYTIINKGGYKETVNTTEPELNKTLVVDSGENTNQELDNQNMQKSLTLQNKTMYAKLKGKIMLKVEDSGKAYYINPRSETMHYLGRPDDAFQVMREQGVGISNSDLYKIPVGVNSGGVDSDNDGLSDYLENSLGLDANKSDTDGDGYDDKNELESSYNPWGSGKQNIDNNFAGKQSGRILLQVEKNGEAWYVNPKDNKRYFLGRPSDAFQVMRNLGLGISNNDFNNL